MFYKIKKIIKKNKRVEKALRAVNSSISFNPSISEITPMNARKSELKDLRINLLVPSINQEHIFGGIATALKFYEKLADDLGCRRRIITTDAAPGKDDLSEFQLYSIVESEADPDDDFQIVAFNDRYNKTIAVGINDIFVSTAWWTAYAAHSIIRWQSKEYNQNVRKSIYFIQDFEPGFYQWSSRYALAESTYRSELPQIAVFNTSLLKEYFNDNGYRFIQEYYFEPVLNDKLKEKLLKIKEYNKKKNILIYGRPSVQRNAFELIVESLKIWAWKQTDIKEWSIYSVGEKHPEIDLGNECKIKSLGKLTINEYADIMADSYLGVSLMISPHPSYPPLEMSTFGMRVITNQFANKNIDSFSKNLISLKNLNPINISDEIMKCCNEYSSLKNYKDSDYNYLNNEDIFDFIREIELL